MAAVLGRTVLLFAELLLKFAQCNPVVGLHLKDSGEKVFEHLFLAFADRRVRFSFHLVKVKSFFAFILDLCHHIDVLILAIFTFKRDIPEQHVIEEYS